MSFFKLWEQIHDDVFSKCDTPGPMTKTDRQKVDLFCLLGKGPKSIIGMNVKMILNYLGPLKNIISTLSERFSFFLSVYLIKMTLSFSLLSLNISKYVFLYILPAYLK